MRHLRYLGEGENAAPTNAKSARLLVGKRIRYLTEADIDRSGRGYVFPRAGRISGVERRELEIDGDWVNMNRIVEMEILEDDNE